MLILSVFLFSCHSNQEQSVDPESVKTVKKLTESNKQFIINFYPSAVEANEKIKLQRSMLINLKDDYRHVIKRKRKLDQLNELAKEYRFGEQFFNDTTSLSTYKNQIDTLLYHVDYIPEKLVMAQAIIESGWGKSKFAKKINNYYGIHCHTPGCGMAASDVENPKFWVKSFPTIEACIEEYMWLLNTGFAFEGLRETRSTLRNDDAWPDAKALARGLERYSEKGSEYIELIDSIIDNYLPDNLDAFVEMEKEPEQPPA